MGKKGQNKIPDRWLDYSKLGNCIPGTKFICLKVPLKVEMCQNKPIPKNQYFTPENLVALLAERGLKLGLLIDLTNTDRYYDPKHITYTGTEYVKINIEGQKLPGLSEVKEFFDAADNFEKRGDVGNEFGESLIGVHCTHGVNRTGYLVCRYLVERKGWSVSKAVHEFNTARGHPIERELYLSALHEVERNFTKTKQAQIDIESIIYDSSSSSSDEADLESQLPAPEPIGDAASTVPPPQIAPTGAHPNWQLFQQMMMGVAQMQAMMRMPYQAGAGAPDRAGVASAQGVEEESSDDEEDEDEEETDEEETDEEESEESSSEEDEGEGKEKEKKDDEAGSSRQGWELGGKVELKPKMTTAQKRRTRRRNLREEYKKMRRGKFWEIREMQKKKYGI